jgi:DNA ligase (NAD+)
MLNDQQTSLFDTINDPKITLAEFSKLIEQDAPDQEVQSSEAFKGLDSDKLLTFLMAANAMYRAGTPAIDDTHYDAVHQLFAEQNPTHEFVVQVEAEPVHLSKTVPLPVKMLSTDKAYSKTEIEKWIVRIEKAADILDIDKDTIEVRVTPKLDGYAAFDDGERLYTRGDGTRGQDISRVFERGLKVLDDGKRGQGPGEIVVKKAYFEANLSEHFENSRNIQASIIAEKNVDENIQKALDDGAAVFCPFMQLGAWQGGVSDFIEQFETITDDIWKSSDFDVDGVIIETTNQAIKDNMGATRHHHRWQIAYKANIEKAQVKVLNVVPQTARTGRISPVVELEPTKLSGAEIRRATAHNYGMVKSKGIGAGALIELVRSGLVIPKIERVIEAAEPQIPSECPSCATSLVWDSDNLMCPNKIDCTAQAENSIIHFFKTLGNNDGFGPATISVLYKHGIKTIHDIYQLDEATLTDAGYKEKTVQNLLNQLEASRSLQIEDWRFLSAFGVIRLGQGSSERLLQHHGIESIFDVSEEQISGIDGFAEKTASAIVEGLANIKAEFQAIYGQGFNLEVTALKSEQVDGDNPIAGKVIVFTGSMQQGSRPDMEKQAKLLGAKVSKSVSGKTDLLVTGEKVGAKKITDAQNKGVKVITEADYLKLIS